MNSGVILEIHGFRKSNATYSTFKVFLSRVQLFVRPQRGVSREGAAADIAVEGLVGVGLIQLVLVAAYEYDARAVAVLALCHGSEVSLFHWVMAGQRLLLLGLLLRLRRGEGIRGGLHPAHAADFKLHVVF